MKDALDVQINNQYTACQGDPLLRQKIAERWEKHFNGRKLDANKNVLVTNGAIGSIYSVINNLVGKGDVVHMFEPYFTQYINHIEFAGADCCTSPMHCDDQGAWSFDFDHLEKSLNENSKILMITNPHNPTGKMFTEEDIARLSQIMEKWPQCTILNDEVYWHLPFDGRKLVSFPNYSEANWAKTVNVFSAGKMYNATGWKIGWCIGPEELIQQAFYVHEASVFTNNVPA